MLKELMMLMESLDHYPGWEIFYYSTGKQKEAEKYSNEVLKLSKEAGNLFIQSEGHSNH